MRERHRCGGFGRPAISEPSPRDTPGVGPPVGQLLVSEGEQEPGSRGLVRYVSHRNSELFLAGLLARHQRSYKLVRLWWRWSDRRLTFRPTLCVSARQRVSRREGVATTRDVMRRLRMPDIHLGPSHVHLVGMLDDHRGHGPSQLTEIPQRPAEETTE